MRTYIQIYLENVPQLDRKERFKLEYELRFFSYKFLKFHDVSQAQVCHCCKIFLSESPNSQRNHKENSAVFKRFVNLNKDDCVNCLTDRPRGKR